MLSFARAFEKHYFVLILDIRLLDIVNLMMLWYFLANSPMATYIHFIAVDKMTSKFQGASSLLVNDDEFAPGAISMEITSLEF